MELYIILREEPMITDYQSMNSLMALFNDFNELTRGYLTSEDLLEHVLTLYPVLRAAD